MKTQYTKKFQTTVAFLLGLIVTGMIFQTCSTDGASNNTQQRNANRLIPAVEAVQARSGALPLTERLTGVVRAVNQVAIYPEVSAVITEVFVKNGSIVVKGAPLVRLRDSEFQERLKQASANYRIAQAQIKQAEARLQEVNAELRRTQSLAEKGLASDVELEQVQTRAVSAEADLDLARARVEQAQATVDERQESLSQTVIRAPITGSVGDRNAEVGMLVGGNTRLFTLGQLDSVRIEIVLTDRMLNYIEEGQRAEIRSQTLSRVVSAPLSRISPFLHPVTHSTDAEIDISNKDRRLKPGMFVTVDVYYGESDEATLVPMSALYEHPSTGVTGVYVSSADLDVDVAGSINSDNDITLTEPLDFEFVPVDVVARGRMEAGIRGVEPENWIITLGQDLLDGESGKARARPVQWNWVEELQLVQRQDLLDDIMRQRFGSDTLNNIQSVNTE
ncbi:MAG: efflux RND transporter periplasmic adaptor subunit [Candidatus Marinimicrobia bacterium]|nr:efflux RND transporter periplasmic adaptor subunit [Candidatus Neomarinimicrobiota bacterium]MCF7829399.1 efflux RND transporter periplasmic adaptor subunit [Candidatus Neomarinimicrobiota bacterium]MCF7880885.1 efflux RND transporter periplasmic adaptor subunit [Candidatus Neomarinimicrobiota bacterium]